MYRNAPSTIWSRAAVGAAGACAALALAACGGSDEGDVAPAPTQAGGGAEGSAPTTDAAAASDLRGCLEAAGFTVQDGSTPAELLESLGIEQQLRLVGPDEGIGSVTVYGSMDAAEEGLASETATETEGVAIARVDSSVYTYTGEFESESAIDGCLR